jgi:hypothetical protein
METITFQDLSLIMLMTIAVASLTGGVLGYIVQKWKDKL